MGPKLIVMLTYNDQTVKNAIEVFNECRDLQADCWGFKNIGLPVPQMKQLVKNMKKSGKTTFLEVVTYTEAECMHAAKLAVECGFDYLMGTLFYNSVATFVKSKPIRYFPFCGHVSGSPSILEGSVSDMVDEAKRMKQAGVNGFDLLAYRYTGDAEALAGEFIKKVPAPVVLAGSINSYKRLDKVKELNPWGYTIGSALFDKKFENNTSFRQQLIKVIEYMKKDI
ncbi:MAG: hypothetical protein FIA99_10075 [Ruminiclostridium sp.]|nr:hypothetical protein [Ruminiclostridium sp.]